MNRKSVIIIGVPIATVACLVGFVLMMSTPKDRATAYIYLKSRLNGDPDFRYLYTVNGGESRFDTYIYQCLDDEKHFASDCKGCKEDDGHTILFHSYVSAQTSQEVYDRMTEPLEDESAKRDVIEQSASRNRAMTRISQNGKTIRMSLFWIEEGELWEITSVDERHILAFQRSQFFHMIKPSK